VAQKNDAGKSKSKNERKDEFSLNLCKMDRTQKNGYVLNVKIGISFIIESHVRIGIEAENDPRFS
jgi:hypothetical protein